jgi:hypothetical protein
MKQKLLILQPGMEILERPIDNVDALASIFASDELLGLAKRCPDL